MELYLYMWINTLLLLIGEVWTYTTSDADSLYSGITFGYNRLNRPSETVAVSVDFQLISINYLDTNRQEFSISGWLIMGWSDPRLSWISSSNGNIDEMYLDGTTCWTPKIMVDNSIDEIKILEDENGVYRVSSGGEVSSSIPGVFTVLCSTDVKYFPYDIQTCYISVRSVYDNSVVSLSNNSSVSINLVQENNNWKLTDSSINEENITISRRKYSIIKFHHKLKRTNSYYLTCVIIPFILTSLVGVFVFVIPSERPEKTNFGLTVLLSECVLLVLIADILPSSSRETPILATYILIILILTVLEILLSVIMTSLYNNTDKDRPLSGTVRVIALVCTTITCKQSKNSPYDMESIPESRAESNSTPDSLSKITLRRKPSLVTPDISIKKQNGDLKRARNEHAWKKESDGSHKIVTAKDLIESVNTICFVTFLLFWLTSTIVVMIILSSSVS